MRTNPQFCPTRAELEACADDYRRAAQAHARLQRFETCEAYLDLYAGARAQMDLVDASELDLDIPISVEDLDAALFASSSPSTLRSHL